MRNFSAIGWAALGWLLACSSVTAAALEVREAWIREAPPAASVLAAYMAIRNTGKADAVITAVASPDFDHTELHRSVVESGIARMVRINELEIAAGETISLDPGGIHMMLIGPLRPLHDGDTVTLTIQDGDGISNTLTVPVIRETGEAAHHH